MSWVTLFLCQKAWFKPHERGGSCFPISLLLFLALFAYEGVGVSAGTRLASVVAPCRPQEQQGGRSVSLRRRAASPDPEHHRVPVGGVCGQRGAAALGVGLRVGWGAEEGDAEPRGRSVPTAGWVWGPAPRAGAP